MLENLDLNGMIQQLQEGMKAQSDKSYTATSGGGMVEISVNGDFEVVDMNIDDSNRDDFNKILSAYITADIYNRIPIEVVAHADIIDQEGNVLFTVHDDQGNTDLTIPGAEVDANGIATTPYHKVLKIPITNQEMQNVLDGYQVRVSVGASSTGSTDTDFGPYVRIRANDFLRYKLKAGGVYHVEVNNN